MNKRPTYNDLLHRIAELEEREGRLRAAVIEAIDNANWRTGNCVLSARDVRTLQELSYTTTATMTRGGTEGEK